MSNVGLHLKKVFVTFLQFSWSFREVKHKRNHYFQTIACTPSRQFNAEDSRSTTEAIH